MAIKPKCGKCGKELDDFGAILLSPPNEKSEVKKFHLCKTCYDELAASIEPNDIISSPHHHGYKTT